MKKTVFITLSLGVIARNILKSDIYKILAENKDVRTVFIAPDYVVSLFDDLRKENIFFEGVKYPKQTIWRRIFLVFSQSLLVTRTTEINYKSNQEEESWGKSLPVRKLIFKIFGKWDWLKKVAERLDIFLFRNRPYQELFDKYQPSLIFATSVLNDSLDGEMLKEAKRRKIFSIGMPKSWDSFNKKYLHLKSDLLLVWSDLIKEEAVNLQKYEPKNIVVTGGPQFDVYAGGTGDRKPNDSFLKKYNLDSQKPVILFVSLGDYISYEPEFAEILIEGMEKGLIPSGNIFIRPYSGTKNERQFDYLTKYPFVRIQKFPQLASHPKWSVALMDQEELRETINSADVMVGFGSTFALDACFFDKPIILIAFDGKKERYFYDSPRRFYETAHYRHILDTGAVRLVHSKEEMFELIKMYLKNPKLDSEKRQLMKEKIAGPVDGKSAERIAELIFNYLVEGKKAF